MNGVLNVYKEAGYTSHEVVAKLRGILKQKKIGHTGTLDPGAEGVLPVCLGNATRLSGMLTEKKKTYEAVLLLGRETDTQDIWGRVEAERTVDADEETVRRAVLDFQGSYDQIPPMYSARRVGGKRLYELAREGKEVERRPKRVEIYGITVQWIRLPRVCFTVDCGEGTYIRTLCRDIGERLGCGGCMESLLRTRVGNFVQEESLRLSKIQELADQGRLSQAVIPVDRMFREYPRALMKPEGDRLVYNGNSFSASLAVLEEGKNRPETLVRVYDSRGVFVGVYRRKEESFRPVKMFLS